MQRVRAKRGRSGGAKSSARLFLRLLAILAPILLFFAGWQLWHSDAVQMRFIYMWPWQQEILRYSGKNRVDPFLIAAIIKNESNFNQSAVSEAGAVGLMQIMPETGRWIAAQMGLTDYRDEDLYKTGTNISMGCWYVSELEREFQRNLALLMIAYNAGRGQAREWMRQNGWDYDFNDAASIPYADTREYVVNVLRDRDRYYLLYRDKVERQKNY